MDKNTPMVVEATKMMNNVMGEKFASYNSMDATYIPEKYVPDGFVNIIRSLPSRIKDHLIFGKRSDGQYIGISQPYPIGADTIIEANKYCEVVGLSMAIGGASTWNSECTRIMFQRDDDNIDRFDVAVNSSRWHNTVNFGNTEEFIRNTKERIE